MKTDDIIEVSALYDAPIQQVWNAISVHQEMIEWYFENIPDFKAELGFKTKFLIENEGRKFTHCWEVLEVEPNSLLTYSWQFDEHIGKSKSIFQLEEIESNKTKLKLTTEITEDFDDSIPEFKAESCQAGWQYFLNERLGPYLES